MSVTENSGEMSNYFNIERGTTTFSQQRHSSYQVMCFFFNYNYEFTRYATIYKIQLLVYNILYEFTRYNYEFTRYNYEFKRYIYEFTRYN